MSLHSAQIEQGRSEVVGDTLRRWEVCAHPERTAIALDENQEGRLTLKAGEVISKPANESDDRASLEGRDDDNR